MKNENELYPELSEAGKEEAQRIMTDFKKEITSVIDGVLGDIYCDVATHIESDSWTNYRNYLMSGFRNYGNKKTAEYDFKDIRKQIYKEFRAEIIEDLNQDILKENEDLKSTLEYIHNSRGY